MLTSTEINSLAKFVGFEKAVEMVAKAGFGAWDFSMFKMCVSDREANLARPSEHVLSGPDYLKFARQLKQIGLDNGIVCNQSHAPFPSHLNGMDYYIKRAIECTAEAGGKICVIHPVNNNSAEENAEMYQKLLPFAKEHGVRMATENMWNWDKEKDVALPAACSGHEDFVKHVDLVGDSYLTACLDIGHAEMMGDDTSAVKMIKALGKDRLGALHVHDNDRRYDSHQIPFTMQIDFDAVIDALREIGYEGDMTLECDAYLHYFCKNDKTRVFEGVANLAAAANRLVEMFKR